MSRLVKAEPRLLVYDGHLLHGALHAERVVEAEVLASVRQQGIAALEGVEVVVLETDGSVTVIPRSHHTDPTAIILTQPPSKAWRDTNHTPGSAQPNAALSEGATLRLIARMLGLALLDGLAIVQLSWHVSNIY